MWIPFQGLLNNFALCALWKRKKSSRAKVSSKNAFYRVEATGKQALPLVTASQAILGPGIYKKLLDRN